MKSQYYAIICILQVNCKYVRGDNVDWSSLKQSKNKKAFQ